MAHMELRIAPPIVLLTAAALDVVLGLLDPTPELPITVRIATAGVLLALALAIFARALSTLHAAQTTANPYAPQRTTALVTHGIFAVTRNPMYLGMVVALLAIAAAFGSPLALVSVVLFTGYIDRWQIRPEERALLQAFGPEFAEYCRRTRRWI